MFLNKTKHHNDLKKLRIKNKTWGGNVKIKLEICNLRIYDDPYRAFKIYAA